MTGSVTSALRQGFFPLLTMHEHGALTEMDLPFFHRLRFSTISGRLGSEHPGLAKEASSLGTAQDNTAGALGP